MSLKDTQKQVDDWIKEFAQGYYWQPFEMLARITEETGELAREICHRYGAKKKKSTEEKKEIEDEIADLIFTIMCMANAFNIDLDEALQRTITKYSTRDKDRWKDAEKI